MANKRYTRYTGTIVGLTVDIPNATIELRVKSWRGTEVKHFWTNDYNISRHLDSYFSLGDSGYINATSEDEIVGYGK